MPEMKIAGLLLGTALVVFSQSASAMEQGRYEGPADGGWLSVTVRDSAFEIAVANERGCGGSAQGRIVKASHDHWTVAVTADGQSCKLDIMRQGSDRYNIEEDRCSYFHGASCSFSGFVTPKHRNSTTTLSYNYGQSFGGYECTDNCSGHKAGFEWAERNGITDEYECVSNSASFDEGCAVYVDDPYRDPDFDDDGKYVP